MLTWARSTAVGSRYNQAVKRPLHPPDAETELNLQAIDALFDAAGLVRNRRGSPAGITRQLRLERVMPQELSVTAPEPRVAANGVQLAARSRLGEAALAVARFQHAQGRRRAGPIAPTMLRAS